MYCMYCGAKLADTERCCPLCGTQAIHPDILREEAEPLYPYHRSAAPQVYPRIIPIVATTLMVTALLITLMIDLQLHARMSWSGFVAGALNVGYVLFVLPLWFRRPNPVVFVLCSFAAIGLYLLYIDLATGGGWFLSFAFPVTGCIGLITTAVVTLLKYLRRGRLYVIGGACIALGAFMPLLEFLIYITFDIGRFAVWFMYPMTALMLFGGMLLVLAMCRPAKELMERKFFL